jgi:glycine dehydrogenase
MPTTDTRMERAAAAARFADRHIGPRGHELTKMLEALSVRSLDELIEQTVPRAIRAGAPLDLPPARSEAEVMAELAALAARNRVMRSYLGMGYAATLTPPVIQRNVLENPGWYTQYTPYQAEIAQGRLEALLNFQTMVLDLTGLPVANASLLDEATAAAEAMTLCRRVANSPVDAVFFVSERCHPQTVAVLETRAAPLSLRVVVGDHESWSFETPTFGALVQYPASDGEVFDYTAFAERAHRAGAQLAVAADLLALTLLRAPGEFGADVCVGNSQRLGVPLGFGGPHAAFMACREAHRRQMPGRIVGVSRDTQGRPALRLALSTREQHIRRDKATSNICTAQVLLAVMASMYAVWHGPEGLTAIAAQVRRHALRLARGLRELDVAVRTREVFDTLRVSPGRRRQSEVLDAALARGINLRAFPDGDLGIALDETVGEEDLADVLAAFGGDRLPPDSPAPALPRALRRQSAFLTHPVFHEHRSETEMLRYLRRLESRDLSLTTSMIPLGSCTMKLNATAEMVPVSYPGFALLHPFAPIEQAPGYVELFSRLERWLAEIAGFAAVSLMPNAGSQGEYAGLLAIRAYHASRGEAQRDVCLIPVSAHGTNPASAVMAGLRVVSVACDARGNVVLSDLESKVAAHAGRVAAMMLTYPSTYGVFEEGVRDIIEAVHREGGQVYLDGANMNALVGLCRPGEFGADVAHLNLHKTFCIPHGGGGPGMGPIGVAPHLAPFLPRHPLAPTGGSAGIGPVSAAPWGSPSILPISYAYLALMGPDGLRRATEVAILSANYVASRLAPHYPLLFTGRQGRVAHECVLDLRPLKQGADVEPDDVAKRLMDYGFHAPTMSWPVAGTLMIEPTESESLAELDRFCEAMISIRGEVAEIERGEADRAVNLLKMAPHTADTVTGDTWERPYPRSRAAFPSPWTRTAKFWPAVSRIDNAYGDRNFVCACPPVEAYD